MEYACRDIGNVMIFLFKQNPNALTGFKIPIFYPHIEAYPSNSNAPSYLKSSPKVVNFLSDIGLWEKKTKISIVLIPKNDKLKLECPIEIARLSVKLIQMEKKSDLIDDFRDIEYTEADKPDDLARNLNQVMSALVSGCLLSPYIGMDMIRGQKKQKMIAQKFWVNFQTDTSTIYTSKSVKKNSKNDINDIIVLNPENDNFGKIILTREQDNKDFENDEIDDLEDLNDCTHQSRDGSDNDSNQPFMGRTHYFAWKVKSADSIAEISLQVHDNLNSICSFIKKTHLDEKSLQPNRRNRFLSEDMTKEVKVLRRRVFRNERNNSFVNIQHLKQNKKVEVPFRILKDELIKKCLNRKNQTKGLLRDDISRVQLTTREEKNSSNLNFSETKWSLTSKKSLREPIITSLPDILCLDQSLKKMFHLAKYLKAEMKKELRVNKKLVRYSEHSMKAKRSDRASCNYFSEQKNQRLSEKYFSIKEQQSGQEGNKDFNENQKESQQSNQMEKNPNQSKKSNLSANKLNTLIKFKR
jgi:hypothetical protein